MQLRSLAEYDALEEKLIEVVTLGTVKTALEHRLVQVLHDPQTCQQCLVIALSAPLFYQRHSESCPSGLAAMHVGWINFTGQKLGCLIRSPDC